MKTITIKNAQEATDIGNKENPKLTNFEITGPEEMDASDGYHTFDELYDHRISLFITLCRFYKSVDLAEWGRDQMDVWRSKRHNDGELCFGTGTQYILGIGTGKGKQISYHIPIERWDETNFAETLEKAPEFDGHTSADVITRLKNL